MGVFLNAKGNMTDELSLEDFERQADESAMVEYFRAIDVDPSEAKGLFRLLDCKGDGRIDAEAFLSGCLRLRGPAKALDFALLLHEVKQLHMSFEAHMRKVDPRSRLDTS